eukprot:TRINITY_DN8827_c0_g1_i2.p1 TRINITY_DN8827_c0_g1~~TRINITY_DN8827_c0_g1_i2.p1  ORF type:complete len:354 (+),score=48.42 TRINITY_DN8827_c0_g1_i2:495-1556(+)
METGRYLERMDDTVERTMYVHREHKNLLVHEMKSINGFHEVCIKSNPGPPSKDINFTKRVVQGKDYAVYYGWTQIIEWDSDPNLYIAVITWEPRGMHSAKIGEISSWSQYFNLDSSKDPLIFHTMITEETDTAKVLQEYEQYLNTKSEVLMSTHMANWKNLRQTAAKIKVEGYTELTRTVNSSVYELLISLREDVYWSSSPGGLTTNSYNGHVFWDFETWMYPVYLVMHPILAKNGLQYRLNHLPGARKKAADNKYLGAMWPWESSYSGDEMTPRFAKTGQMEHHISGDIVFAARQYDYLHRNAEVRKNLLCPLAIETAIYWASRPCTLRCYLSLIHICRCRRLLTCRSRWSP